MTFHCQLIGDGPMKEMRRILVTDYKPDITETYQMLLEMHGLMNC